MAKIITVILKKIIPKRFHSSIRKTYHSFQCFKLRINIKQANFNHNKAIKDLIGKKKIKIAFVLIHHGVWKYDSLYNEFNRNKLYEPIVIICPFIKNGDEDMWEALNKAEKMCQKNGYKYFDTWDSEKKLWRDFKQELQPDIVFFSIPHAITRSEYCIKNFSKTLTCYVPYSIRTDHLVDLAFNSDFQQLTWKNFYETIFHKKIAEEIAFNQGVNVEVVGYPTLELIRDKAQEYKKGSVKRIIWAPHWTISKSALLNRSCFLEYYDFFIELANQHLDTIEIILRPHPFLKRTLYELDGWGKKRTDDYFSVWDSTSNLSVNNDDYIGLFASSDLLIHDSVSFLAEYLVTSNPTIFTKRRDELDPPFNEFGAICLQAHYVYNNKEQLHEAILDILFNGRDEKFEARQEIVNKYLLYEYNSSTNIYNIINRLINNDDKTN
ncbi:MAG: hypothetical protein GQ532_01340 [Methylomarinum sp.]|nr:hypothetical protein [Methylomarinum sp.]